MMISYSYYLMWPRTCMLEWPTIRSPCTWPCPRCGLHPLWLLWLHIFRRCLCIHNIFSEWELLEEYRRLLGRQANSGGYNSFFLKGFARLYAEWVESLWACWWLEICLNTALFSVNCLGIIYTGSSVPPEYLFDELLVPSIFVIRYPGSQSKKVKENE